MLTVSVDADRLRFGGGDASTATVVAGVSVDGRGPMKVTEFDGGDACNVEVETFHYHWFRCQCQWTCTYGGDGGDDSDSGRCGG